MANPISPVDPDGLLEYSVVFTDRSLNHMSQSFQQTMRDIHGTLCSVYNAKTAVVVPGGGTFGMEAVARQFATDKRCMIIRNGWFSFRWSQILEAGSLAADTAVLTASTQQANEHQAPFSPPAIEEIERAIEEFRPDILFAPHVETSSGIIMPDDYIRAVSDAMHRVDGLFVLDCVASGCVWVDMVKTGVDVLISAPQKGWSASPNSGLVMMGERAIDRLDQTSSNSFALDLAKWHAIMQAYVNGGHAYHSTMPTDALVTFCAAMQETVALGLDEVCDRQWQLGRNVRALLKEKGFLSVAAVGFEAPGVVVCYTDDPALQNGSAFAEHGMQIAAGVPLECGEGADFRTFRIGLFGLDKLGDVDGTVERLRKVLDLVA